MDETYTHSSRRRAYGLFPKCNNFLSLSLYVPYMQQEWHPWSDIEGILSKLSVVSGGLNCLWRSLVYKQLVAFLLPMVKLCKVHGHVQSKWKEDVATGNSELHMDVMHV